MQLYLQLSVEQINLILGALSKLSYETSADLIAKIKTDARAQIDAATKTVEPPKDEETKAHA